MSREQVMELVDEFRAARRTFEDSVRSLDEETITRPLGPGAWAPREVVLHIAAWLREAGERIPALMAGAPPREYDVDAFNAAAVGAAAGWSGAQAFGAYKRAADRFEMIVSELDDETLEEEPDVRAWLESAARVMITEHVSELCSLGIALRGISGSSQTCKGAPHV